MSAPATPERPLAVSAPAAGQRSALLLRYLDVAVLLVALPIMLLIGVPAVGYCVGAGAWIALRLGAASVERSALAVRSPQAAISLRLGFLLSRLFLLAIAVILVRQGSGRDAGLTTLLVIVGGYTISLFTSIAGRPQNAGKAGPKVPSRPGSAR